MGNLKNTQACIGILMLDSRFPRIVGDIGNAQTWSFPVRYKTVRGASPDLAVKGDAMELLPPFIEAAQELVAEGVDGITTSCGFLALFQKELAAAVSVPVVTSSLMQVAMVNRALLKSRPAGILTISAANLTDEHLVAAEVPLDTPIGTTDGGSEFNRVILGNELELDVEAARRDNVEAANALVKAHPYIGALVLECTNMSPYACHISAETGLPVYSIVDLINWFQAGLSPTAFKQN